jgi:hypothetical protein
MKDMMIDGWRRRRREEVYKEGLPKKKASKPTRSTQAAELIPNKAEVCRCAVISALQ